MNHWIYLGRGIIALQDIKEGTLLAVSKAFSSGYDRDYPGTLYSVNLIRNKYDDAHAVFLLIDTVQKIHKNPEMAKDVYDLYAGDDMGHEDVPFGMLESIFWTY